MRRRAFIFASGCALLPTGARSQHRAQVGFLHPGSAAVGSRIIAVREGLANAGGVATNAAIIPALAEGRSELLPRLAADLAARSVDVICAVSPPAVKAALMNAPGTAVIAMELCGEMGDGGVRRRRIVAVAKTARTSRRSDTPWRRLLPLSHSARSIRSMIH
jgi:hypothetical protein